MANGIKNASDQKITATALYFSHNSPMTNGHIAIHRSIPTNGIQYASDRLLPSSCSAPFSAANDTAGFTATATRSIDTIAKKLFFTVFILLRLLCKITLFLLIKYNIIRIPGYYSTEDIKKQ